MRLAVVDVETTGLGRLDRILEVSVVVLDGRTLEIVEEFDTLVNPLRDVGPTRIHGISSAMVGAAPVFEEVAQELKRLLDGSLLVAHNLSFDHRFLESEFDRLGGELRGGPGLCTLNLTRQRLEVACAALGIEISRAHRALADARACAELLRTLVEAGAHVEGSVTTIQLPSISSGFRTLRREAVSSVETWSDVARPLVGFPGSSNGELSYLQLLDRYLGDGALTVDERAHLDAWAVQCGVSVNVEQLHKDYLASAIRAAGADQLITDEERHYLEAVASALNLELTVPEQSAPVQLGDSVTGLRVCFTGEPVIDGNVVSRETLSAIAVANGLLPVESVTKKRCDLLVAADISSASGKAKKARDYGIPVISAEDFMRRMQV